MEINLFTSYFVLSLLVFIFAGQSTATYKEVQIVEGKVLGITDYVTNYLLTNEKVFWKPYFKFLGIPYAQPPIGSLRFKPPQPPLPWKGIRNALVPGQPCMQFVIAALSGVEDCLYLNVYTPQFPKTGESLRPVMVWIYGGGFDIGDGGMQLYGPDYLVSKDVVVVTFNYRVNVLGFLSLENNEVSGNFGLKDQVEALRWVQRNIIYFGGDPNRVTVFGESAGAASVQYHLLSPLSKGLFNQAILQSGSALNPWAFTPTPKQNAIALAQFMRFNTTDEKKLYDFFMKQSAVSLVLAARDLYLKDASILNMNVFNLFLPSLEAETVEQAFITESPKEMLLKGNFSKVPMMIGTLNAEGIVAFNGMKITDADFKLLNNASGWAVPLNWRISSKDERTAIGQVVKNYFFKGQKISWDTVNEFTKFFSDKFIIMDVDQSISIMLKHSEAPIYNYEMIHEHQRSIFKLLANFRQQRFINFKGAAHADDIPMIFRPYLLDGFPFLYDDQMVSLKMTKMWTNFAKTGNPNYSGLEVFWERLRKDSRSYLEIGKTFAVRPGRVQAERMQFWEELCKQSSTNYTCVV